MAFVQPYVIIPTALALSYFLAVLVSGMGEIREASLYEVAYYVALVPVAEELLFRGFFQRRLFNMLQSLVVANILTSVAFAGCHLIFSSPIHALLVFFPSLVFGFVYGKTGSLFSACFVHGVFNMNVFINYRSNLLMSFFSNL